MVVARIRVPVRIRVRVRVMWLGAESGCVRARMGDRIGLRIRVMTSVRRGLVLLLENADDD